MPASASISRTRSLPCYSASMIVMANSTTTGFAVTSKLLSKNDGFEKLLEKQHLRRPFPSCTLPRAVVVRAGAPPVHEGNGRHISVGREGGRTLHQSRLVKRTLESSGRPRRCRAHRPLSSGRTVSPNTKEVCEDKSIWIFAQFAFRKI